MTRKPKRLFRRSIAIFIGLFMGWMAADIAFEQLPSTAHAAAAPAEPGKEADHHDEKINSVEALKVEKSYWFGKVVAGAFLLFIAAAVLGPFVLAMKGPDPVERDDHGHDDHAHGAHDAHGHGGHDKPHAH